MKKWEISLLVSFAVCTAALWLEPCIKDCEAIKDKTLRLHIVANSDSERDQQIKLAVRDAVLPMLSECGSIDEAVTEARSSLDEIERVADEELKKQGVDYRSRAEVCEMSFDERTYGNIVMPAGSYTSLRITLGNAEGKNWWCVLYPALCLSTATDPISEYTGSEKELLTGTEHRRIRFKIVELIESLI